MAFVGLNVGSAVRCDEVRQDAGPMNAALPSTNPAPTRAAFVFIFITVALDMLALGVMVPVLPKLIVRFKHGDMAEAAGAAGIFGFAWAAMQFIFSPVLGAVSDRSGRRPVILLSNLGLGPDYVLMTLAPSLSWLFVGRLISGLTSSSFSTAGASAWWALRSPASALRPPSSLRRWSGHS